MESQATRGTSVTPRSVGVKWGFVSALIAVLIFLILAYAGVNAFNDVWSLVGFIVLFIAIFLAHRNYKTAGDGFMTYGQGVGIAFWVALVNVLFDFAVRYCYVRFLDPAAMDVVYDSQAQKLAANGMPDDQIDMAISLTRIMFWPMFVFIGLCAGVLIGVIVSIFTQKKNPEPAF